MKERKKEVTRMPRLLKGVSIMVLNVKSWILYRT